MARERPGGPREASAACASTSFCAPSDLRTRESAPKSAHGYAKRHGGCSNRNELHACVCVPFPSISADQRWCPWTVALGLLVVRRFAKMYRNIRLKHPILGRLHAAGDRWRRLQPAQPGRAAVKNWRAKTGSRCAGGLQWPSGPKARLADGRAQRTGSHSSRCSRADGLHLSHRLRRRRYLIQSVTRLKLSNLAFLPSVRPS